MAEKSHWSPSHSERCVKSRHITHKQLSSFHLYIITTCYMYTSHKTFMKGKGSNVVFLPQVCHSSNSPMQFLLSAMQFWPSLLTSFLRVESNQSCSLYKLPHTVQKNVFTTTYQQFCSPCTYKTSSLLVGTAIIISFTLSHVELYLIHLWSTKIQVSNEKNQVVSCRRAQL